VNRSSSSGAATSTPPARARGSATPSSTPSRPPRRGAGLRRRSARRSIALAAGCERALEVQADAVDLVCGYPLRWGLGYGLDNPFISGRYGNRFAGRRIAFWGGSGGSTVFNDFDARMTVAFVMNRHLEHGGIDQRGIGVVCAAYDALVSGS
jgi:hypothetical protein